MLKDLSRIQTVMLQLITALLILSSNAYGGESPISFGEDGIGVSFLGFNARAGIGGNGKLHASAGTPWGAQAGAGIEGKSGDESSGGLFAGATSGGGISAGAGLAGGISKGGSYGGSFAHASNGEKTVEVIKEKSSGIVATGEISADYKSHYSPSISKHVQVVKKPVEVGVVEVVHETHPVVPPPQPPPEIKPVTTVIQKTVIPNYEKKIVKVPSYEEKVIRVPTVVEKEVWVPAAPTIIEKEVQVAHPAPPPPPTYQHTFETVPVVYKTRFKKRPFFRKHITFNSGYSNGYSGGYAGQYSGEGGASAEGTYTASVRKTVNPQFFSDIINIPVSTLGAVNKFLTNAASGASAGGSFEVSKSFSASKSVGGGGYASSYH